MNIYALLKLIHIFAVIIFLGNIITGLYWMKKADKTNNLSIISFAMKGIISSVSCLLFQVLSLSLSEVFVQRYMVVFLY